MATTQYIGSRYVPIFADPLEWNSTREYEALTIVSNKGNSYTAKQYVPKGIEIANQKYWALTGNYNAQIEQYRRDVTNEVSRAKSAETTLQTNINSEVSRAKSAETTLQTNINSEVSRAKSAENAIKEDSYSNFSFVFNNVKEMKKATFLKTNMLVKTKCFKNSNDNGAGFYLILENLTPNEMDIIQIENTTYFAKLIDLNAIEQLGCIETETIDCTKFFKRYFELSNILNLKNKIYYFTQSLEIPSNTTINKGVLKWDPNANYSIYNNKEENNITFNNVIFDINFPNETKHSLNFFNNSFIYFNNCVFKNAKGSATRLNGSNNIYFYNCNFKDITGDSKNPGECIYGGNISNVFIKNCTCENITDHFCYIHGDDETSENIQIENCISKNTGKNETTQGAVYAIYSGCKNIEINNCIAYDCKTFIYAGSHGVSQNIGENLIITNCIVKNCTLDFIQIFGLDSNKYNYVKIDNCLFDTASQDGLKFRHVSNSKISNCYVKNFVRNGIESTNAENCLYENCEIETTTGQNGFISPFSTYTGSKNCIARNLNFKGVLNVGFYIRATGNENWVCSNFNYDEKVIKPFVGQGLNSQIDGTAYNNKENIIFIDESESGVYANVGDLIINKFAASNSEFLFICTKQGLFYKDNSKNTGKYRALLS